MGKTVQIEIVSDVVCPWCYIGRKNLGRALADRPGMEVSIRWRPFMLHPFLGPEGMDRDELMTMKFGRSDGRMFDRVREAGRRAGIDFRFDDIKRIPDTTSAHCFLEWANEDGVQDAVAERLFSAFFEEALDVSDPEVLTRIARENGMDDVLVRGRLDSGQDRERIRSEAAAASAEMITGVPYFVIDNRYPIPGAQPAETILEVLQRIDAPRTAAAV